MLLKISTSSATPVLPLSIMIKFYISPTSKLTTEAICKEIYSLPKKWVSLLYLKSKSKDLQYS